MQHKYSMPPASARRLAGLLSIAACSLLLCVQDGYAGDKNSSNLPAVVGNFKLNLPNYTTADLGKNRNKPDGKGGNGGQNGGQNNGPKNNGKKDKKNQQSLLAKKNQMDGVSAELVQPNTNLILSPQAAQQAHDAGLLDPALNFVPGQPLDVGSPVTSNGVSLSSGGRITGVVKTNNGIVVFFVPPGQPDSNAFSQLLGGVTQFEPPIIDEHGGHGGPVRAATAQEQLQLALPRRYTISSVGSPTTVLTPEQKNERKWLKFFDSVLGTNYANGAKPGEGAGFAAIFEYLIYIQLSMQLEESLRGFIADYPPSSNFMLNAAKANLRTQAPTTSTVKIADKIMEYGEKAPGAGYGAEFEQLQNDLKARLTADWTKSIESYENSGISSLWDELTNTNTPPSAARQTELYAQIEAKIATLPFQWTKQLWQLQLDQRRGMRLGETLTMPYQH